MHISKTYSHLYAAEYLLVRKPSLYNELTALLTDAVCARGMHNTLRSKRRAFERVRGIFETKARQHRWIATSFGYSKQRVVMAFHLPTDTTAMPFDQVLSARFFDYAMDKIDVGVEILPLAAKLAGTGSSKQKSTLSFEHEVNKITRNSRNTPRVPLLLIGVSP